ncbi:HsmA family protein [Pseudonocardia xishanensis]|uniref:HsmA family protein n=1 Tax=Pseudonocardia xishanensis TaxID=630995 RepID=A0ABP8RYH9_9PSEU
MGPAAGLLVTVALVSYTTGVWAERRQGTQRARHVWSIGVGSVCDLVGTSIMTLLPDGEPSPVAEVLRASGYLAAALMALHVVAAGLVLRWGGPAARRNFPHFSVTVWSLWLVPYLAGVLGALIP